MYYLVTTCRSGFENQESFADLDKAEAFFKSECEQIGAPVTFCSVEDENDDDPGAVHWIESYDP